MILILKWLLLRKFYIQSSLFYLLKNSCVISTMCSPNIEYQYINPSTQVALFSDCVGRCRSVLNIHWKIYQGLNDSLRNIVEWTPFTQDFHFFGK
jgi:hypothetical protein